jgi:hypothetical protein
MKLISWLSKMNHIDELMLDLLNSQNDSILEILQKKNTELKKMAFRNYHHVLLKKWFIGLVVVVVSFSFGLILGSFISGKTVSLDTSSIDNLTKTIITPSMTMNGLFVTFIPVISFFFLSEIKEMEKESKTDSEKLSKKYGDQGIVKNEIEKRIKYEHAFFHNFRTGILNYVRTYVTIGLVSLLFLLFSYVFLSSILFLILDIEVLAILLFGIYPIISVALYKPSLTLVTIPLKDGEQQEIMVYD